jgi:hypothetical protein
MKAYVATGEHARLICAYDKNPAKALKSIAKKVEKMMAEDEWIMLSGVNIGYDDEGFYNISATVTTTNHAL